MDDDDETTNCFSPNVNNISVDEPPECFIDLMVAGSRVSGETITREKARKLLIELGWSFINDNRPIREE